MARESIVVVEDEAVIREAIVEMLEIAGYAVKSAIDGNTGLALATANGVDLVLLDLMLPGRDGFSVLTEVRRVRPALPVIILTAKGGEDDVVRGLRDGADDYVVKPFGARELLARMEAVLRRSPARPEPVRTASLGEWEIDFERRELVGPGDAREHLTDAEAALLSYLVEHRERSVSREELLARLWGVLGQRSSSRTVDMHIARLRAKLGEAREQFIMTVRGRGYMLAGE